MAPLRKIRKILDRVESLVEEFKGSEAEEFLNDVIALGGKVFAKKTPKSNGSGGSVKAPSAGSKPDA